MLKLFSVQKGYKITDEDCNSLFEELVGIGAPGGDAGDQDAAPLGSIYHEIGSSNTYKKIANAGATTDWELFGAPVSFDMGFRNEKVRVGTSEAITPGVRNLTTTPFTDDDGTTIDASAFSVGEFIISGIGTGSPVLLEVTAVSAPNVTFATPGSASPLAEGDNFVISNYLPDAPDDQEAQALVHYNGTDMVKLGDVNWNFADGIALTATYAAAPGDVQPSDTVEQAIAKLDGNLDALNTLLGTAQGALDLGVVAGGVVPDNSTVKAALEALSEKAMGLPEELNNVAALTNLDSILVDDFRSAVWLVSAFDEANPGNSKSYIVHGINNGTAAADATAAGTDYTVFGVLSTGAFNSQISVSVSGAGATQQMNLEVNSSEPGVTYTSVLLGSTPSGY